MKMFVVCAALACAACGGQNATPIMGGGGPPLLEGRWLLLPFARRDIHPGTMIVLYGKDDLSPFCQMGIDYGGAKTQEGSPESVTQTDKSTTNASLRVNALNVAQANFGTGHVSTVEITATHEAIVESDPATDVQQNIDQGATGACRRKLKLLARAHNLTWARLVTAVVEVTADYTVTVDSTVAVDAGVAEALAKKINVSASGAVDTSDSHKIHVTGAKIVRQYRGDDRILADLF